MVLIKMEMPNNCAECFLHDICFVRIMHDSWDIPEDCLITEVEQYGPEGTLYKEK